MTAVTVFEPKVPSTTSPPRPCWSTWTAAPVEPSFSVVPLYGVNSVARAELVVAGVAVDGAVTGVVGAMSAFHTLASVTPVTGRPLAFWYSFTRASVSRP